MKFLTKMRIWMPALSLFFAGHLFLIAPAWADWYGRVDWIIDGDSLQVLQENQLKMIRLQGIDAPEHDQPFGNEAKKFAIRTAKGKIVRVVEKGIDKYGRTLAEVFLPDGQSLNQLMVAAGMAWRHVYFSKDKTLMALEKQARQTNKGLWAGDHPVAPWQWKRKKKKAPKMYDLRN